jgi:hypothetical protein
MKNFYDTIKRELTPTLLQSQVEGINNIVDEYKKRQINDKRILAYVLATVWHETAATMQPVKEKGGIAYLKKKVYYPYYGRDLVQTTWKANYEKVKAFSGIDVVTNPDLIAEPKLAVKVAFHFMLKGWYTGKKLGDYFKPDRADWINARRIINGTDKAELVANHAKKFLAALQNEPTMT